MKVKKIELDNFSGLSEVSVNLNPDVNYLCGPNGSGKSTIGSSALYFILTGIAERGGYLKGSRFRFIGDKSDIASGTIVLENEKGTYVVTRKMTADKQWLEITTDTGEILDQAWLNSFFKNLMVSPMDFTEVSPKEQAAELGIDTSIWDAQIEDLKIEATIIGREIKAFGEVDVPEKAERVDVSEINRQKNEALAFNHEQAAHMRALADNNKAVSDIDKQIIFLEEQLQIAKEAMRSRQKEHDRLPMPRVFKDTDVFDRQMEELEVKNDAARKYEEAVEKFRQKQQKEEELSSNKSAQKQLQADKTLYLQDLDLPFSNLTIGDDGGLLMDGRPIQKPYYSDGELLRIVPQIIASRNYGFKYLFIQHFDLLDEENQKEVVDMLVGMGFQLVIEKVGKRMDGENVIILEEKIKQHAD